LRSSGISRRRWKIRIAQNLAFVYFFIAGPGYPWNMVAGYWLLLLRAIRWLVAAKNRDAETLRLPVWRIAAVGALVVIAIGIFALALIVPSSSWG
jgi:hypothetical protein